MTDKTWWIMAALAFASAGCSEAVPPAAEGGATVSWASSNPNCRVDRQYNGLVGYVTSIDHELVKNTVNGVEIDCSVVQVGDGFDVEASIRDPNSTVNLEVVIPGLKAGATETNPALGSAGFSAEVTSGALYVSTTDMPCRFWLAPNQEVAAGRAWFQFGCQQIVDGSIGSVCGIQNNSSIAIQNCDQ